jgi:hypothetical protein
MEDLARLNSTSKFENFILCNAWRNKNTDILISFAEDVYLNKPWFKFLKNRWITNYDELEKHYLKLHLRNNETGGFLRKFEQYPTFYRAANLNQGHWTTPHFDCEGHVKIWSISYASPFFGWDTLRSSLELKLVPTQYYLMAYY